jgi:superfamily II DNA or RNA helicase
MDVRLDGWAWLNKKDLSAAKVHAIKKTLTIIPRKTSEQQDDPDPISLYEDREEVIGIPREYFLAHRRAEHNVMDATTMGSNDWWPSEFVGRLKPEQHQAFCHIVGQLRSGRYGGILQAKPGYGKTVCSLAIVAELKVPTLVVVHKEFLVNQWIKRISKFLPSAKIGRVQQDECDYKGKTIVVGMVHSLAGRRYPDDFYSWPGCVLTDEIHRVGAPTWSVTPPKFPSRYRLGVTATPRRKDGADAVFWTHVGPILFTAKDNPLVPKIKRVWSKFKLIHTDRFNPSLAPRALLINFLCGSKHRNKMIVDLIIRAVKAERKCLILSERLAHLNDLERDVKCALGSVVSTGQYVGGLSESQRERSAEAQVIFATSQFASEGLDIPALDTLILATPLSDVEQAVGRIRREFPGKKDPIVVDIRDDFVPMFEAQGRKRDRYYNRM